ncbi:MAG: hypothetical protein DWQ47_08200 [Acidobacteria bacterium]|nr:MAG: hypothetical protein DWQ32_16300 [Acidobacteriota bacterium]REJ99108.1 MAG: hypothetical protein DWQ38_13675 [Acidobacteriota bacterium]REK16171.1 MAG: hypothetical protein DWQ43_04010 [Acidobacteriota bacterium]REK43852.1 MAG: hypothetical protein DWQ47_08200 [Acidobacteriota bacterium]
MKNGNVNLEVRRVTAGSDESGAALVLVLLVLLLLMGFVAMAISRTNTEAIVTNNDVEEARAYAASEAALDTTTRDFADIFEVKLAPNSADIINVQSQAVPGFPDYTFSKTIGNTQKSQAVVLTGGSFGGLYALRDSWEIEAVATNTYSDVKVGTRRRFFSDRIPIFQFGVFYEDDLELNRPPLFTLGGRVHSNGNFFVSAADGYGIYLSSKVTAAKEIVNDIWKTKKSLTGGFDDQSQVFVNDDSGVPRELLTGQSSVICRNPSGPNVFASRPELPYCSKNANWVTQKAKFQGNLESNVKPLNLPLTKLNVDLIELVKRGKNVGDLANVGGATVPVVPGTADSDTVSKERFANKTGIRISLADSKQKLPGCAAAGPTNPCGVRLDGPLGTSIGYRPKPMTDGYVSTALNATRMAFTGREIWIKIETMDFDVNLGVPVSKDITEDILSLGVTERAPVGSSLSIAGYTSTQDSRSVVKLQRFAMRGPAVPDTGSTSYTTNFTLSGTPYTFAARYNISGGCFNPPVSITCSSNDSFARPFPTSKASVQAVSSRENDAHLWAANINGSTYAIAPFPIMMFDTREGLPNDSESSADSNFGTGYVPAAGVMSMIDIDVANLRKFFAGDWDGDFPVTTPYAVANGGVGLRSVDIPEKAGWVLYVSDRRGDYDFDGEYDMEDVFPNGVLEYSEDVNRNGLLDTDYLNEATSYTNSIPRGQAATADHWYFRRGVRLINGSVLPGVFDTSGLGNTRGFTVSSENGVYVLGNYNATGAGFGTGTAVTPPESYYPQNTANHIPAAIIGDAVTILSNNWTDGRVFQHPFSNADRPATNTVVRFAMISGDAITGNEDIPYSPSGFGHLNGGLHNFKRFLEYWTDRRLNYAGSLINLTNSRNNNGFWTCCTTVYRPPIRDWTFDTSFLDPTRLPPGTPFIYSISFTGFQRVNG